MIKTPFRDVELKEPSAVLCSLPISTHLPFLFQTDLLNMKRVIVYGGQGGLGQVLVSHLKGKGYWIVSGKHIK